MLTQDLNLHRETSTLISLEAGSGFLDVKVCARVAAGESLPDFDVKRKDRIAKMRSRFDALHYFSNRHPRQPPKRDRFGAPLAMPVAIHFGPALADRRPGAGAVFPRPDTQNRFPQRVKTLPG
ncbi:MAG: hypothetical protein WBC04_02910 [Candidatus Acidiferrales bacterium]